jgi:hypothetical protein
MLTNLLAELMRRTDGDEGSCTRQYKVLRLMAQIGGGPTPNDSEYIHRGKYSLDLAW